MLDVNYAQSLFPRGGELDLLTPPTTFPILHPLESEWIKGWINPLWPELIFPSIFEI